MGAAEFCAPLSLAESRVLNVGMTPMRQILPYVTACSIVIGILSASADFYSVQPTPMMSSDGTPPSIPEAVSRMVEYRRWHDNSLREYEARRLFQASNRRFKMDSTMEVQTLFHWPYSLQSTVIRHEGSSFIKEHVFEKILAAETELASSDQADIIPKNYDFTFLGKDICEERPCWRLALKPKRKDKYLIEGQVWIDASDFGIARVEGSPAKRPSFWLSNVNIDKRMRRIEGVWLTYRIDSSSDIRLAGNFKMQIEYSYDKVKVVSPDGSAQRPGGSLSE